MNLLRAIMPGLVVLLALGSGALGQSESPATATGTPKIVFAQPVHNFGELKPNDEVTHEFAFTNTGDAILEITKVQSTCGCTAVAPSKKLLAPGESSVIKVTYHAGRAAGMSEKKILVYSNDPEQAESVLTIRAAIKTDLEFNPSYIRFDNIPVDAVAEASVFFMAKDPDAFKLTDLKADDPFLRCDWRRTDDGRFELKVAFVPEQVKADHRGYLNSTVRAKTNSESFPVIQLPVYIKFQEEFAVVPTRLMMYGLKAGTEATRDVIVKSNKGVAFQITAAESSNPFVRAEVVRNGEVANVVKIVIDAKAPAGLCNATVTVRMGARHLAVPVRARIGDAAATPAPSGAAGGR